MGVTNIKAVINQTGYTLSVVFYDRTGEQARVTCPKMEYTAFVNVIHRQISSRLFSPLLAFLDGAGIMCIATKRTKHTIICDQVNTLWSHHWVLNTFTKNISYPLSP